MVGFFVLNLFAMIATVVIDSFATRWLRQLAAGRAGPRSWYGSAWDEFQLGDVLTVTFEVVFLVVRDLRRCSASRPPMRWRGANFPGKQAVMLLFLLPLLVPPITYGIPLATVLYQTGLAGTMSGVVVANLVPTVPFVILVMIPFIEQIDPRVEAAARVFGANTPRLFVPRADPAAAARRAGGAAAGAGAHHRDVRADLPDRRPDQPDAGGGALLRGVRGGRAGRCSRSTRWRWSTW